MRIILFAMALLLTTSLSGETVEIHTVKEIDDRLPHPLLHSDWIIFDIDYTLTEPGVPALQMRHIKQNKKRFFEEMSRFSEEEKLLLPALMITQSTNQLTDPHVPALIQKLQNQPAPVLAFTSFDTAELPHIGPAPQWRQQELKRLGIDFSVKVNEYPFPKKETHYHQFSPFRHTYPLFQDGILYANVTPSKGEVLGAFLDTASEKPTRIIFIDDSLENIESVQTELQKRNIAFIGFHYRIQCNQSSETVVSTEEWEKVWDDLHSRTKEIILLDSRANHGAIE